MTNSFFVIFFLAKNSYFVVKMEIINKVRWNEKIWNLPHKNYLK